MEVSDSTATPISNTSNDEDKKWIEVDCEKMAGHTSAATWI